MPPNREDFQKCLSILLEIAKNNKFSSIAIESSQLHRLVCDYSGPNHRMPVCCGVMRDTMKGLDSELPNSLKKDGATLQIRYNFSYADRT